MSQSNQQQQSTSSGQSQSKLTQDLPNLNFGLYLKQIQCLIHPNITPNILEHFLRKPEDHQIVVGVLLGTIDGTQYDISSCFAVPMAKESDSDQEFIIDSEYLEKMLKFYRKVNPKEGLLGIYISSKNLDEAGLHIVGYFSQFFNDKKNKAQIQFPLVMCVDPTLQGNQLSIKMLNFMSSFQQDTHVFCECQYQFVVQDFEKSGLDILFYNQEHFDTMSILDDKRNISQEQIVDLMNNQKILSNKDLLLKNMQELINNLDDCEKFIEDVQNKKQCSSKDLEVGRMLDECMGQFSNEDMSYLEQLVSSNYEDAILVNSLSKLQKAQITMTEKLNNIFAQSINKNQTNRILQKQEESKKK